MALMLYTAHSAGMVRIATRTLLPDDIDKQIGHVDCRAVTTMCIGPSRSCNEAGQFKCAALYYLPSILVGI